MSIHNLPLRRKNFFKQKLSRSIKGKSKHSGLFADIKQFCSSDFEESDRLLVFGVFFLSSQNSTFQIAFFEGFFLIIRKILFYKLKKVFHL